MSNPSERKILIVDDTKLGRLSVKKVLGKMNLSNTLECDNGTEVRDIIEKENPSLVLMDILMPGKNGVDTLKDLRESGSQIPVVMITADIQDSTRKTCKDLGADGFVSKPVKEESLRTALEDIGFL